MQNRSRDELLVVVDTNVFISYLWGSKNAQAIADLLFTNKIRSVISEATLQELVAVGRRGKFKNRFSPGILKSICEAYKEVSLLVVPKRNFFLSADTKDNIFLECAFEAKADYIVSGDHHLLQIGNYEGIHIVTPAGFLKMIQ